MNESEQIEEIVDILLNACAGVKCGECSYRNEHLCQNRYCAQKVIDASYRKASEVARETIEEAIEVVRHIFDEAKIRANNETNVLLRCQFSGEQIGASLVEYALTELKKKYTEGEK